MRELPYTFDLHYDIKMMWEIETIAKGEPHCSDASPEDLVELFIEMDMEIPECLSGVKLSKYIWLHRNNTWTSTEPENKDGYTKVRRNW